MSGVRLVINLHAEPGQAEEYAKAWAPHYEEVNAEPGCLQYELFQSTTNPDNLVLLEWWEDKEAFDAHWAIERTRAPLGREFIGRPYTRVVGKDTSEIYWDQKSYRYDAASDSWLPRP